MSQRLEQQRRRHLGACSCYGLEGGGCRGRGDRARHSGKALKSLDIPVQKCLFLLFTLMRSAINRRRLPSTRAYVYIPCLYPTQVALFVCLPVCSVQCLPDRQATCHTNLPIIIAAHSSGQLPGSFSTDQLIYFYTATLSETRGEQCKLSANIVCIMIMMMCVCNTILFICLYFSLYLFSSQIQRFFYIYYCYNCRSITHFVFCVL